MTTTELDDRQRANLQKLTDVGRHVPDRLDEIADRFHPDFLWTYVNPELPEIAGQYRGVAGFTDFFARLADVSNGSFRGGSVDAWPIGPELAVVRTAPSMTRGGRKLRTDAVVVWRFVDGLIHSAWDIPASAIDDGPADPD
ncbi:MAG: nuclear transport factor 2 family protein [Actinomycetota bacterium]